MRWLRAVFVLFLLTGWAWSQTEFSASLSTPRCGVGDQVILELRLSGPLTDPGDPQIPDLPGLDISPAGVSKNLSSINGITTSSSSYSYVLTPRSPGNYKIPAIGITVAGTTYTSNPVDLVVDATSRTTPPSYNSPPLFPPPLPWGGPQNSPSSFSLPPIDTSQEVLVECEVSTRQPYVNQLVVYTFRFLHRVQLRGNPNYEPPAATGFLREDMGQRTLTVERNGVTYSASEVKTAFFATSAGPTTIGPTRLTCAVIQDPFSPNSMFQDPVRELTSEPIELNVRPVPSEGKPPSFQGAVGTDFQLQASLPRTKIATGQASKLQITLSGDGHPDLMMEPSVPGWAGLRVYAAETAAPVVLKDPFHSSKVLRYPLVAQKAGRYKLQPITFSFFDPRRGKYRTLNATPLELEVEGPTVPDQGQTPGPEQEVDPLGPPSLKGDSQDRWAASWWILAWTALPWGLSALGILFFGMRQRYRLSQQTREARLRRCIRQVKQARSLEQISALAYQGLEVRHEASLKGLPLNQLRETLPYDLIDHLRRVEALRYAPESTTESNLLESLRQIVLRELKAGLDD